MMLRIVKSMYASRNGPLRAHLTILPTTYIKGQVNHTKFRPKGKLYWHKLTSLRFYKKENWHLKAVILSFYNFRISSCLLYR